MILVEEEMTFFEFAEQFLDLNDMETPQNIDISALGVEIETMLSNGEVGWSPMTSFIVKNKVDSHWQLDGLKASASHEVLHSGKWTRLCDHPDAVLVCEPIHIVDTSVEETENYIANGHINHNTCPGGMSIPFHSSVRIKLGAGQQILDKDKNVIGINVSAKTIKNKIAAPFRKVDFEIHFGKGIKEHEQLFNVLRKHGPEDIGENTVSVGGTGSWKMLIVSDAKTGEVKIEKKFYKADFDKILIDPQYKPYLDDLIEKVFIKKLIASDEFDLDTESYEEVKAVADDLEDVIEDLV